MGSEHGIGSQGVTAPNPDRRLEVERLSRSFGGLAAVSDVSFSVEGGTILGLIGPNGAGKTTAINLITGLLRPNQGVVRFAGRAITGEPIQTIAALGVRRTFQILRCLPELSALDNVLVGAHLEGRAGLLRSLLGSGVRKEELALAERAHEILARVGLGDRATAPCGTLPFGQQRLVELARALVAQPRLLLLDEPASGLTRPERGQLAELLRSLRAESGLPMVVVEHDMDWLMPLVDRVVVMNFGRVLAAGEPDDVRGNADVIDAYLGVKAATA